MMKSIHNSVRGEIVLCHKPGGATTLDVRLRKETLWLTQAQIADLFQKERSVITKHLRKIFDTGELVENCNVQKLHIPGNRDSLYYLCSL